jgi:hypothetical protein
MGADNLDPLFARGIRPQAWIASWVELRLAPPVALEAGSGPVLKRVGPSSRRRNNVVAIPYVAVNRAEDRCIAVFAFEFGAYDNFGGLSGPVFSGDQLVHDL